MKVEFISPSYKRAGNTKTNLWCDDLIMAVHEFEAQGYIDAGCNVRVLTDDCKGNMAKVRNEMLDSCKADIQVQIDDDVKDVGYYEKLLWHKMDFKFFKAKVLEWAEQAKELGTVLFGMNLQSDPKFYREYSPISLSSPVLGTLSCILTETEIRYDERLGLNEDYDFFLQVIQKHHKALRWNKYSYRADHLSMAGGCGAYRVLDEEKRQAEIMIKKWGNKVVRYNLKKSTNPALSTPYKGI